MKEFIFIWSIENISYAWHKTGEHLISPLFNAEPIQGTSWILKLYPRGRDNTDYLSLFLYRKEDDVSGELEFNFEFSLISADSKKWYTYVAPKKHTCFLRGSEFGESHFINRLEVFGRKKDLYLPLDILTLCCRMWWDEGDIDEFKEIFGRTRLVIERIVSVEAIYPDPKIGKTFHIHSKVQNRPVMFVMIGNRRGLREAINVYVDPIGEERVRFCTCKLTLVDKVMERKVWEQMLCSFNMPKETWSLPLSVQVQLKEDAQSHTNYFEFITEFIYSTGEEIGTIESEFQIRHPIFLSNYLISCGVNGKKSISEELLVLYQEKALCDVELKTEKKSFFAHKFVLCARSPVLLAMLIGEMKENINTCIEIQDISADTLEKFLIFLYKDTFENLEWDSAIELYYAANKYKVERLKFLCCSYLLKNVNFDTICDLLILADKHCDSTLKQKVDTFIWENEEEIIKADQWNKYNQEQRELAMKTITFKDDNREGQSSAKSFDDIISSCPDVLDDFRSLYQAQIVSDVVIRTKSASFPAHKTVLFASSFTFKDMMKRTSTGSFELQDLEDDVVSRMLLFLYTDSIEDAQWETALKLYHAADVFQIQRLKIVCSVFLLENLREANASDVLLLAHEHSDDKLKSAVIDYILLVDEDIFASDEWAKFSRSNLLLANEIMCIRYKKIILYN